MAIELVGIAGDGGGLSTAAAVGAASAAPAAFAAAVFAAAAAAACTAVVATGAVGCDEGVGMPASQSCSAWRDWFHSANLSAPPTPELQPLQCLWVRVLNVSFRLQRSADPTGPSSIRFYKGVGTHATGGTYEQMSTWLDGR